MIYLVIGGRQDGQGELQPGRVVYVSKRSSQTSYTVVNIVNLNYSRYNLIMMINKI